jgi:hypothetical protein
VCVVCVSSSVSSSFSNRAFKLAYGKLTVVAKF